jgi:hypothetical protein
MTVRVTDHGAERLLAAAAEARRPRLCRVGVLGDEADASHGDDGITVAAIAEIHELGLGVPRRSWLVDWVDTNLGVLKERLRSVERAVVAGHATTTQGLEQFGVRAVAEIQVRMANRIEPPLAESTIVRKGSSVPLIDTGQLRSSITYEVVA